jgi:hypothetical protein
VYHEERNRDLRANLEVTMETKTFRGMKHRRMGNSGLWVSEVGLGFETWDTFDQLVRQGKEIDRMTK